MVDTKELNDIQLKELIAKCEHTLREEPMCQCCGKRHKGKDMQEHENNKIKNYIL